MSNDDANQLDLLSIFHYIVGGITALFSCIPFFHVFMGIAMVSGHFFKDNKGDEPPAFIGWLFIIMGIVFILLGWMLAASMIIAGRKLKLRKHRMYCLVVAGIECMLMPFGTILGVFTIIALNKDSIRNLFAPAPPEGDILSPPPLAGR